MRHLFILFCIIFLFNNFILGQNQKYVILSDNELGLINDLSSTFKDTSIVISPLISPSVDSSLLDIPGLVNKYGFNKSQFEKTINDVLLIKGNKYFEVISLDSLVKYENAKFDTDIRLRNQIDLFQSPVLYFIEKNYNKSCLCYFYRPVFSKNGNYAIAEFWVNCGEEDGWGETVLMKKAKDNWIIVDILVMKQS